MKATVVSTFTNRIGHTWLDVFPKGPVLTPTDLEGARLPLSLDCELDEERTVTARLRALCPQHSAWHTEGIQHVC